MLIILDVIDNTLQSQFDGEDGGNLSVLIKMSIG